MRRVISVLLAMASALKCGVVIIAAAVIGVMLVAMAPDPASADPIGSHKAIVTSMSCGGEEVVFVIRLESGTVTAHEVGTTGLFVVTHFSVEIVDSATGEVVLSFNGPVGEGNKEGLQEDLVTCTTTFEADGLVHHDTVEGFFVPRGS